MAVTNDYSANSELYGESAGGVMTTYMTDALGSTIGTFSNGTVVNSYAYSPDRLQTSKTGSGAGRQRRSQQRFIHAVQSRQCKAYAASVGTTSAHAWDVPRMPHGKPIHR